MKLRHLLTIFTTLLFFISVKHGLSADDKSSDYGDTLKLWKKSLILSSANYSYRNQEGDIGLVGSKVKRIVKDVPQALNEIQIFQNYRVNSFFLTLGSGAVMGFGITEIIDDNDQMGISLLAVGSVGLVGGIIFDRVGYGHLKEGVRKYNDYVRMHTDTSEWEEEAIVYYPGSKSEKVATNWSVYGTFLPITLGSFIFIVQKTASDVEPGAGVHLFFITSGATIGPSLGYFYCDQWTRGGLGIGIRVGLTALTIALAEQKDKNKSWESFDIQNEYLWGGCALILASIVYDIMKVDDAVRKYNRKFSEQSFRLVPKYFSESKALGLGMEMKF